MKKYLVESIGTFFFTTTICLSAVYGTAGDFAAIPIGIILAIMVYCGGHVSGGHYNPAVTLGVFLRGRCPASDVAPYIISQIVGALLGGMAAGVMAGGLPEAVTIEPLAFKDTGSVLLAEFLFTYALVYAVLNTATAKANDGNSFYGLAIGSTVMVGVFAAGGISGGGFNPAVSVMLASVGKLSWADSWMHFVPQLLAGILAAFTFKFVCAEDK